MKTILLISNLAQGKEAIYDYALNIAQRSDANLILLHVVEGEETTYDNSRVALESLKTTLLQKANSKTKIDCAIEKGTFLPSLKIFLNQHPVDLLIMGAADGKNDVGFLFGVKVRHVVEEMNCPVLVIPEQVAMTEINNLIYVTDIRYGDAAVVKKLTDFAKVLHLSFSLLHVCADGLPNLDTVTIQALIETIFPKEWSQSVRVYKHEKGENADAHINNLLLEREQSVLAIAQRKYHFFHHLLTDKPTKEAQVYKHMPLFFMPV